MVEGYYNEYTGNPSDGNQYCRQCGNQTPVGFKHHHASEVPALKQRIRELEAEREKTESPDRLPVRNF